jgi:orotate phosphoribosyltransferase
MDQNKIIGIFRDSEALLSGHFKLTSGFHSDQYLQCAKVLQYPAHAMALSAELIARIKGVDRITVVIGPAVGGITLSYEIGRQLDVRAVFSEREDGRMTLRRGFTISEKDRVLVVEDVLTTGGSVREVIDFVRSQNAEVLAVGSIVDRSNGSLDFGGIPYHSLLVLNAVKFAPEACPLCAQDIPLQAPGSKFLKKI